MQPGQQTTTRTEQRMDNDARIGNSIPAIGPMHGARQARTTACKAASRSALATGTLLLLLCLPSFAAAAQATRSEEHTSELQSLMRISYAVFCLKKKKKLKCQVNS